MSFKLYYRESNGLRSIELDTARHHPVVWLQRCCYDRVMRHKFLFRTDWTPFSKLTLRHYLDENRFLILARDSGHGYGYPASESLYRSVRIFSYYELTFVDRHNRHQWRDKHRRNQIRRSIQPYRPQMGFSQMRSSQWHTIPSRTSLTMTSSRISD